MGSDVLVHTEHDGNPCPCRTPEGFRDLQWHEDNPQAPICNENGMLVVADEFLVKASVQPISQVRGRLQPEMLENLFTGEVQSDDHLGFFPVTWGAHSLDFHHFSDTGSDYIVYDGRTYIVVAADKLPDIDGDPDHHWEVGLRLADTPRLGGAG
jgi:hypothetical protein